VQSGHHHIHLFIYASIDVKQVDTLKCNMKQL